MKTYRAIPRPHLRDARRRLGKSAYRFGIELNHNEQHVQSVERGRCSPDVAEAAAWAAALGMAPEVAFPEIFGQPAASTPEIRT